jgi:predicted metal-dependent HD superfamily phosphohydrolase
MAVIYLTIFASWIILALMKPIQEPDALQPETASMPAGRWAELEIFVLQHLEATLSPDLLYHGLAHTRDDVLPAVERLATLAGLDPEERLLLRAAALYHDAGFAVAYQNNEIFAEELARESLPCFDFSPEQIDIVARLIRATAMPQRPESRLEALLCDADLDSLGREDYLETSLLLWRELAIQGERISLENWYRRQIHFLTVHSYFTREASTLRDAGKARNIRLLERLLRDLQADRP